MYTTYHLNSNDLDIHFIEAVKALFRDKEIEITIYEADETEYLLKSDANRKRLAEAMENVRQNRNLVEISPDDLL